MTIATTVIPSRDPSGWLLRLLAFAAIYIVWGSTFLAIRYTTATIPPLMAAGLRVLVGGALLYGYLRARGVPAPSWRSWSVAAVSGGMLFVGCHGVLGWASQRVPTGVSALLTATISLWMVVLGAVRARTMPNRWVAFGLVLGFAGLLPLIRPDRVGGHVDVLASVALVLGALSWAAGSLYARGRLLPRAPLQAAAMQMFAGGVLLILLSGAVGEWSALNLAHVTERSLVSLAYLIVVGSIVTFGAYVWLLQHASAASVSTYAFVNPVVALLLGWLFGGEGLSVRTLVATALIVIAVAMITMASSRPAGTRTRDA